MSSDGIGRDERLDDEAAFLTGASGVYCVFSCSCSESVSSAPHLRVVTGLAAQCWRDRRNGGRQWNSQGVNLPQGPAASAGRLHASLVFSAWASLSITPLQPERRTPCITQCACADRLWKLNMTQILPQPGRRMRRAAWTRTAPRTCLTKASTTRWVIENPKPL